MSTRVTYLRALVKEDPDQAQANAGVDAIRPRLSHGEAGWVPKSRGDKSTSETKQTWAERVRACMDKEGLGGKDVARAVGVSPQMVSDWRAGRSLPSVENLLAFSRLAGEPVSFLVGDRLHGRDSMDERSRRLGALLGAARLEALESVDARELRDHIDLLIGRQVSRSKKQR